MSPTGRTLVHLRRLGFLAAPVERWIVQVQRKVDLFGIGDVLAVHPRDRQFLIVQATSIAHVGDRLKRCQARPELSIWLQAGGMFEVWGWGKRSDKWEVKRVAVNADDMAPIVLQAPRRRRRLKRGERQRSLFDAIEPVHADGAGGVSE